MKQIPLTHGKLALVDDQDFAELSRFRWRSQSRNGIWYAFRLGPKPRRKFISMHRAILNAPEGAWVDHANCDGLDNRRANLRVCSRNENVHNQRKQRRETSSRFKGVSWDAHHQKWRAQIRVDGHGISLGRFASEDDAADAYDAAAVKHFGAFARPNRKLGRTG